MRIKGIDSPVLVVVSVMPVPRVPPLLVPELATAVPVLVPARPTLLTAVAAVGACAVAVVVPGMKVFTAVGFPP